MFSAATKTGSQPAGAKNYIEDVFSTWLYTGSGTTNAVPNGIPLANASNSQFTLAGYTVTNLGAAFDASFPLSNLTDGIVETTNAANLAYVASAYFDVYVDLTTPTVITAYNIAPQGGGGSVYNTPTDFIVKASNDASTWTTVATFTGISTGYPNWNPGTLRVFSFANTTAYRYWRVQNTSLGDAGSGVAMSEWNLTGTTTATVKGGLVWIKSRSAATGHRLTDTVRGATKSLESNSTAAQATETTGLTAFGSTGFTIGADADYNTSAAKYCSWTFAEQAKFFDVVTFTSTETTNQRVSHNLGSVPGMIFVKKTSGAGSWFVYHRSEGRGKYLALQSTIASQTQANFWGTSDPTSTDFGLDSSNVAAAGDSLVAYLFAHNAGGFGTTGTDNVISCSSYTTDGSGNASVSLGYEPQYVLVKKTSGTSGWYQQDIMRSMSQTGALYFTYNTANAEADPASPLIVPTATGFDIVGGGYGTGTWIYMAIRRPMKVPTDATTVFSPVKATATTPGFIAGFPVDMGILKNYPSGGFNELCTRLLGATYLTPTDTSAEGADSGAKFDYQNGWYDTLPANTYIGWNFARRPGFFDVVCYTGNGTTQTVTHNLGVAPELVIVKQRNATGSWYVWAKPVTSPNSNWWRNYGYLNNTSVFADWGDNTGINSAPTSTTITYGGWSDVNGSGNTFVNYLFATCPGVSKVGSYTGNGTTQAIACGFTGGARFVLIKPTSADNAWYVYDTARGMTTLTDPYLRLNSTAAQSATLGSVTSTAGGFTVNASIFAAINTNAVSYLFLAIA